MRRRLRFLALLCVLLGAGLGLGRAHVGSPDVYVKASAGPYQLLVSVHPPVAVPGAAGVDVRAEDGGVRTVTVAVEGGEPQSLQRYSAEQLFTGSVWVQTSDAWRVLIHVSGDKGEAEVIVPIPPLAVQPADLWQFGSPFRWIAGVAALLCVVLVVFRRRRMVLVGGAVVMLLIVVAAVVWAVHTPYPASPKMQVVLLNGGRLRLNLPDKVDDLVDDHGHLMHLFAVREPQMDVLMHLHPEEVGPGRFEVALPSMAAGAFHLYADVVHRDGRLVTYTASAGLPAVTGHVLVGDDSVGVVPGLSRSPVTAGPGEVRVKLADGYTMTLNLAATLEAKKGQLMRFGLLNLAGRKPNDMELYMGMTAHAAVVKADGTVFAHIHPAGTIPMTAGMQMAGMEMAGMEMGAEPASEASFPFGFPAPGTYRMFVQMKHAGIVETGAFDLLVQ